MVEPLSQVVLLLFLGLVLLTRAKPGRAFLVFCAAAGWLWLASTPLLAGYLMAELERDYPPVAAKSLPEADVILLLGGAIRGEVTKDTLADMSGVGDRLVFAVAAYKAGKAPVIIVTGGADEEFVPEANLIRDILLTMGVPGSVIMLENRNRVTLDNRRYTRERLAAMGAESVLLVTSSFHMRRSLLVFSTIDVKVYPAPTDFQVLSGPLSFWHFLPSVKALQRTTWAMHEMAGYLYYLALKSSSN